MDRSVPGAVVEIGSGIGAITDIVPDCVTTDLFANPGVARVENAYRTSFADRSVSNLVLFDVWHHLRYPGNALDEFRRIVAPGGRVILFEPAISWVGWAVYGLFHHEPIAMGEPREWRAPAGIDAADVDYFAAQGSATRFFWNGEAVGRLAGFRVREVIPIASFAYLATGGFAGPDRSPVVHRLAFALDRVAAFAPRLCAVRLLIVLERVDA